METSRTGSTMPSRAPYDWPATAVWISGSFATAASPRTYRSWFRSSLIGAEQSDKTTTHALAQCQGTGLIRRPARQTLLSKSPPLPSDLRIAARGVRNDRRDAGKAVEALVDFGANRDLGRFRARSGHWRVTGIRLPIRRLMPFRGHVDFHVHGQLQRLCSSVTNSISNCSKKW